MAGARVCPPRSLERFARGVFAALGADRDTAAEVARHLVGANLAGHDSHGVIRVPHYVGLADAGELDPAARPVVAREGVITALIDARRGFGQVSTAFALDWAAGRARERGLAAAAVRGSNHIGRLGEYTERAAALGLIAIVTVGGAGPGIGGVVPHGGRDRFLSTNPWSIGVPAGDRPPLIFDAATSTIAEGKVRVARARGSPLPPGAIVDRHGRPSTDPEDFYAGGALLPLGGAVAGHKGYGLGLAAALLGGLAMIDDPAPPLAGTAGANAPPPETYGRIAGVFLAVIDPAAFGDGAAYQ
ncbi:MAG: Ldh family oxidoreductase, partial [Chloroflexota bacterium]|nr:Ldh family oxidoreductase [Chloroflexota bacterium]